MARQLPILFSTMMVQALLDGRKTQTRRVVKPQPIDNTEVDGNFYQGDHKGFVKVDGHPHWKEQFVAEFCKYKKGDVLYVRENWRCISVDADAETIDVSFLTGDDQRINGVAVDSEAYMKLAEQCQDEIAKEGHTPDPDTNKYDVAINPEWLRVRSSIHMPKAAARIWLQVEEVRVERVQDISEADAQAESAYKVWEDETGKFYHPEAETVKLVGAHGDYKTGFKAIWVNINGRESWDANPWVWVIKFKVLSTTGKPLGID